MVIIQVKNTMKIVDTQLVEVTNDDLKNGEFIVPNGVTSIDNNPQFQESCRL